MEPLFTEKPVFVGWMTLVTQIPIQLFLTFWTGGFIGGITDSFLHLGMSPFNLFGLMAFFGIPITVYTVKRLNYSRTEYKFYPTFLEFEEGFFSLNKKTIEYRNILEVTLKRGFLQRSCGLGTIYLGTLATGSGTGRNGFNALGFGNISASGIGVQDIAEPDAAYARIRRLIDAQKI